MAHAFKSSGITDVCDTQLPGTVHRLSNAAGPVAFDSAELLRGRRELHIRHGDEVYRLRHTRNDKLILTK